MKHVIFYGAGQNAKIKYQNWIKEGLMPVCFVDADINKQHTLFDKWEILSLYEALNKYPNCDL